MKKCDYCGLENLDAAEQCVTCHTSFATPSEERGDQQVSPEEARFWAHMTFRQFGLLMIRVQSLWLFFNAVVELTYLPTYLSRRLEGSFYSMVPTDLKRDLGLAVLRIGLNVAAGLAAIQYSERLLSWLVRDWVGKQPPNNPHAVS